MNTDSATTLEQVMMGWARMNQPSIRLSLKRIRKEWVLSVTEEWSSTDDAGNYYNSRDLDRAVVWITDELAKWSGARRMAWDQWNFDDRRTAEKFTTLFYMTWEQ